MANGYWQKLLRVDLTLGTLTTEAIAEDDLKRFVGGSGLGGEILRRELGANTDPLGPENRVIFATGPFQGHPVPGGAKFSMTAISPLSGTFADTAAGADFGVDLKRCGYDAVVVQGISTKPVILKIENQTATLEDAAFCWGKDAYDTVDAIHDAFGKDFSVSTIGPAGENKVAIACVVVDKHSFAGRCGLGAVMGSKNLKAVAVNGSLTVPLARPEEAKALFKKYQKIIADTTRENGFREHGTPGLCESAEALGDMPIKYWTGDTWPEGAKRLGAPNSTEVLKAKPAPCKFCPVGCHRHIEVTEPAEYATTGAGPEYETYGLMGSALLIDDPKVVAKGNDLANKLGLDTISAGAMVGFCMEAQEKGWLTADKSSGIDFAWGNPRALLDMLPLIAHRKGLGELFANGTLEAARKLHPEAEAIVVHVKGLDLPAHDPRSCISLVPTYVTGTRGACHFRGGSEDVEMGGFFEPELGIQEGMTKFFEIENQAFIAARAQDYFGLCNALVLCAFMIDGGGLNFAGLRDMFNAITGWDFTTEELISAGERAFVAQRLINLRDGYGHDRDLLSKKILTPATEGFRAGKVPPMEQLLAEYYALRNWTEKGVPTQATLDRLGL